MDIQRFALSSARESALRPKVCPLHCPRYSRPPDEPSFAEINELFIDRYTAVRPFSCPGRLSYARGLLGSGLRGTVTVGPGRDSRLLSDMVCLQQRKNTDIWFLNPMSETLLSAGGGRLTCLTILRTHPVAMGPVGRDVLC